MSHPRISSKDYVRRVCDISPLKLYRLALFGNTHGFQNAGDGNLPE
jgi:hypothetical protein